MKFLNFLTEFNDKMYDCYCVWDERNILQVPISLRMPSVPLLNNTNEYFHYNIAHTQYCVIAPEKRMNGFTFYDGAGD